MDGSQCFLITGQDHHWLDAEGVVNISGRIAIRLTNQAFIAAYNPADQKGRDIEFLPGEQILPEDDDDFGIEHEALHGGLDKH